VGHLAKNFFVFKVEAQGDPGMLEIVAAGTSVRLIAANRRQGDEDRQQRSQQNSGDARAICSAKGLHGHSSWLL